MTEISYVDWDGLVYYDSKVKDYIEYKIKECLKFKGSVSYEELLKTSPSVDTVNTAFRLSEEFVTNEWFNNPGFSYPKGTIVYVAQFEDGTYKFDILVESNGSSGGTDLTNYYNKQEVDALIPDVSNLSTKDEVAAVEEKVDAIVIPEVPTKISELDNDAGYITAADVPATDLSNYYNKTETENLIADADEAVRLYLQEAKDSGEFDGKDGADGGHYTPSVEDNGNGTMTVTFTASKSEMATVNPVTISLPVPDSGGYYTPSISTISDNEFKISFTASKSDMPPVSDVTITLPAAKDGVGIESVVQTTTSTDDGGDNVITITLTDGNEFTFTVKNGSKGSTGRGISNVEKTNTSDLTDTYTITYSDGTTSSYTVVNGAKGDNGIGIRSVLQTTTSEDDSGENIITVTLTDNTQTTFKVKNGSKGSAGIGISNVEKTGTVDHTDTYTITYTDDSTSTFTVVNGTDGVGIKTVAQTTTSSTDGGENVVTVTLTNGNTSTFKVKNGSQGSTGKTAFQYAQDAGYTGSETEFASKLANDEVYFGNDETMPDNCNLQIFSDGTEESVEYALADHNHDGVYVKQTELNGAVNTALQIAKENGDFDGTSVTVSSVTESTESGGSNVVNFSDGKSMIVKNGKDGDPYTLTESDRNFIVQSVLEALGGQPVAGYFDENNNIVLTSALADGTYTVKLEKADGTYNLGTVTVNTAAGTEPDEPTTPTNFANPSDQYWQSGYRLATGYGYGKPCDGHILTNFIPAMKGDVVYVTGLNLRGYFNSYHAFVGAFTGNSISEADTTNYTKRYTVTGITGSSSGEGAGSSVTETTNDDGTTTYSYTILMKDGTDNTPNYENIALDTTAYVRISAPTIDGVADSGIVINVKRNGVWL